MHFVKKRNASSAGRTTTSGITKRTFTGGRLESWVLQRNAPKVQRLYLKSQKNEIYPRLVAIRFGKTKKKKRLITPHVWTTAKADSDICVINVGKQSTKS